MLSKLVSRVFIIYLGTEYTSRLACMRVLICMSIAKYVTMKTARQWEPGTLVYFSILASS